MKEQPGPCHNEPTVACERKLCMDCVHKGRYHHSESLSSTSRFGNTETTTTTTRSISRVYCQQVLLGLIGPAPGTVHAH